ncbi:OLC1v1029014C1 [Oldenlandia corymbosa var. corymbosa]|uniref:OLC1v1029014C1 n=1 Tax=Oldenlandia corymbosa var. corymbosa TaxID=529605 RepID=A0AAV1CD77_OLDCO|nr:OLC1v1029014C1 [Oldenlandia corymbosa var. corymbosa]
MLVQSPPSPTPPQSSRAGRSQRGGRRNQASGRGGGRHGYTPPAPGETCQLCGILNHTAATCRRRFDTNFVPRPPAVRSAAYAQAGSPAPPSAAAKLMEEDSTTNICDRPRTCGNDILPVVNEACRVAEEGITVCSSDIDIASVHGMKFPSYYGGILFCADSYGAEYICSKLRTWWSDQVHLFFKPSTCLELKAAKGLSLANASL